MPLSSPCSPYITTTQCPCQVWEHLKASFETDEYVRSHSDRTINQVVVTYTPTGDIDRSAEHEYEALPGIKKTFLFQAMRDSVLLERTYPCWCPSCAHMSAPGEGAMDSSYACPDCETWRWNRTGDDLPWKESSIARTDAPGRAKAKAAALTHSRSLRDQLVAKFKQSNTPVWVAVQNRGEDVRSCL